MNTKTIQAHLIVLCALFTSIPEVVDLEKPVTSTTREYVAGRTPAKLKTPAEVVSVESAAAVVPAT